MNVIIILSITAFILFSLAYATKRRFGVLGLALAAGYVLQRLWEPNLPEWANLLGLPNEFIISPVTMLGLLVVLLPSLALLFGGPVYKNKRGRLVGSVGYALLALVFCIGPLSNSLAVIGEGKVVFDFVLTYRDIIMTGALLLAVVDMLQVHVGSPGKKH
jgi:hypothetical protein